MPYLLVVGAVAVLVLILAGCGSKGRDRFAEPVPIGAKAEEKASPSRSELEKRLEVLARSEAPTNLKPGAMCYTPAPTPESLAYVCPKCGEKTVYAFSQSDTDWWKTVDAVQWELPDCRDRVKEIKVLQLELDESQFCKKCSPDVKKPQLVLVVRHPGEAQPHRCAGVNHGDLRIIADFLEGKTKGIWDNEGEYPLKKHTKRLGELLGLKPPLAEETK
ncbi:MAG: hypothetical protein ABSE73_28930 [Planctomycetota bacterium]